MALCRAFITCHYLPRLGLLEHPFTERPAHTPPPTPRRQVLLYPHLREEGAWLSPSALLFAMEGTFLVSPDLGSAATHTSLAAEKPYIMNSHFSCPIFTPF